MAARKFTKSYQKPSANRRPRTPPLPLDASRILREFALATSLIECATRSLEEWHDSTVMIGDEATCLRHGLGLLAKAYDALDLAIIRSTPKMD